MSLDPAVARAAWRTLEPYHGAIYFVPEARDEYAQLGITDRMRGYFASRAAPMGAVSPGVVEATFFNFDPGLVRRSMTGVWDVVSPADMVAARLRAVDRMIVRLIPEAVDAGAVAEAAALARTAAMVACEQPEGRPLFAGHADLDWPERPHLVLWHAQTLLREFRGDGHLAALTAAGLSGCEALVTHAAAGDVPAEVLQATRQRTADDWAAAVDRLRSMGWLDAHGVFTELGRERRDWVERRTDELAVAPYAALGVAGCERLRELVRPLSRAMSAAFA
jgi:hypothetical protein